MVLEPELMPLKHPCFWPNTMPVLCVSGRRSDNISVTIASFHSLCGVTQGNSAGNKQREAGGRSATRKLALAPGQSIPNEPDLLPAPKRLFSTIWPRRNSPHADELAKVKASYRSPDGERA